MHKRLARLIKKSLGSTDIDRDLSSLLAELRRAPASTEVIEWAEKISELLSAVEKSYEQSDRMLSIANHSLDVSSTELNDANKAVQISEKLIHDMLNGLDEGFLILDRQGICRSHASKKAVEYLEKNPVGLHLTEILSLSLAEQASVQEWFEFLFEQTHPFESVANLGPAEYKHSDSQRKICLRYKPVLDENGILHSIAMIAADVSVVYAAQEQAELMRQRSEMIVQRYQNAAGFLRCMGLVKECIEKIKEQAHLPIDIDTLSVIRRDLHTLKGAMGMISVYEIAEVVGKIESDIIEADSKGKIDSHFLFGCAAELDQNFRDFFEREKHILGLEAKASKSVRVIETEKLNQFYLELEKKNVPAAILEQFQSEFCKVALKTLLSPLSAHVCKQGSRMGKVIQFHLNCPADIKVDADYLGEFLENLTHLLNNSIDHGLETVEERLLLGKNDPASIWLQISESNSILSVSLKDNGRGVDLGRVREKALKARILSSQATEEQILETIFAHGFSTLDEVNNLSGRGIGLNAVASWLVSNHGSIKCLSQQGIGAEFRIFIPLQRQLQLRAS